MKNAADYLAHIKSLIILNPQVEHWQIAREAIEDEMGLFRYRLTLRDGSLFEMFARFQVVNGEAQVSKYSFHWQSADGRLRKRWDNAAHHPEVSTHPHHLHEGAEDNVTPQKSMTAEEALMIVTAEM